MNGKGNFYPLTLVGVRRVMPNQRVACPSSNTEDNSTIAEASKDQLVVVNAHESENASTADELVLD